MYSAPVDKAGMSPLYRNIPHDDRTGFRYQNGDAVRSNKTQLAVTGFVFVVLILGPWFWTFQRPWTPCGHICRTGHRCTPGTISALIRQKQMERTRTRREDREKSARGLPTSQIHAALGAGCSETPLGEDKDENDLSPDENAMQYQRNPIVMDRTQNEPHCWSTTKGAGPCCWGKETPHQDKQQDREAEWVSRGWDALLFSHLSV